MLSQERSRRKVSGGLYRASRKKKQFNLSSIPTFTKVGSANDIRTKRNLGGSLKQTLFTANKINVLNPKTKKAQVTEIVSVVESPSNRNFIRRSIITKGSIVDTKLGKVKVTSRPGQEGSINGILV